MQFRSNFIFFLHFEENPYIAPTRKKTFLIYLKQNILAAAAGGEMIYAGTKFLQIFLRLVLKKRQACEVYATSKLNFAILINI